MSSPVDLLYGLDSTTERRFYPRINPTRPMYVPFGANNLAMLLNLSENGMLVSTPASARAQLRVSCLDPPQRAAPTLRSSRAHGLDLRGKKSEPVFSFWTFPITIANKYASGAVWNC